MARMLGLVLAGLVAAVFLPAGSAFADTATGPRQDTIVYQGVDPSVPDNDSIFLADGQGGHRHEILTSVPGDLLHPDWSPDGRSLVFVADGRALWMASAAGERPHLVVACPDPCAGLDYAAWSPDGRSIAYTRYTEYGQAGPPAASVVVVRDVRTGSERIVAQSDPGQVVDVPRWSHDGTHLAIGIDRFDQDGFESGSAIATVDLATRRMHRLTAFSLFAYSPDWNPRTNEILFSRDTIRGSTNPPVGPLNLYRINPDGTGLCALTHLTGDRTLFQPAFSPDGRSILATLDEPSARRGVRIDPLTGHIDRLANANVVMTHLKMRP